jgi:hypothetical protein
MEPMFLLSRKQIEYTLINLNLIMKAEIYSNYLLIRKII